MNEYLVQVSYIFQLYKVSLGAARAEDACLAG